MAKTVKVDGYVRDSHHRKGGKVKSYGRKGADVKRTKVDGYTRKAPSKKPAKGKQGQLI